MLLWVSKHDKDSCNGQLYMNEYTVYPLMRIFSPFIFFKIYPPHSRIVLFPVPIFSEHQCFDYFHMFKNELSQSSGISSKITEGLCSISSTTAASFCFLQTVSFIWPIQLKQFFPCSLSINFSALHLSRV